MIYPVLKFNILWCDAKIYYDGDEVYTYTYNQSIVSKKMCLVELPTKSDGKKIEVELTVKNPKHETYIDSMNIIEGNDVFKAVLADNVYNIFFGGMILVFGLIVVAITLLIKIKNKEVWLMFYLGLLWIIGGIVLLSKMNMITYIFGNNIITEVCMYISLIALGPVVFMIHMNMLKCEKIKKILKTIFFIVLAVMGIMIIAKNHFRVFEKIAVLDIISLGMMCLLVLFITLILKDYKNVSGLDRFLYKGFLVVYAIFATIVFSMIFLKYIQFAQFIDFGIMIIATTLLLVSMIYCSYRIREYMDNISENKILETLAYTDPLTGIMNRTKYEEVLKELKEEMVKVCTVIIFDLNNLKSVNDKYGHEAGDEYIKSFSKVLRIGFSDERFIGRIGGDEFVAIIKDKHLNVESIIEMMQDLFKQSMKKQDYVEWVSFAYGIANSKKHDVKSLDELIEMADKNMYECKKAQKSSKKQN
jgi:diguanylate cyclase (GGDEF)-like protein